MRNRILVIDDNPPNLELMMYLLRANGMDVTGADTGAAGLAIAFKGDFDLFVCDIQLPDIDGVEVAKQLRARFASIPTVAVTASAMMGDRERLLAGGFDGYVSKPIDPAEFARTIEDFLKLKAAPAKTQEPNGESTAAPAAIASRGKKILIVDDLKENRYLMRVLLTARGFEVLEASTVQDGLKQAREDSPDLIVCDVNMPNEDGESFLSQRQADPKLTMPVIMVTSSDKPSPATRQRFKNGGALALFTRPIESNKFLALVEESLSAN
jgi:two-component system, cell cycle response regulator